MLQWFVCHTYSGHENKVKINLEKRIKTFGLGDQITEMVVPTAKKIEVKEGKKREVQERIFPGYVMIKMDLNDNTFSCVRHTPGVTGFVGTVAKPIALNENEVQAILQYSLQEAPKFKTEFSVSEAVKIVDGPFADFVGTVNKIDEDQGKLTVLVSIFGRETPVELDFLQVSKM